MPEVNKVKLLSERTSGAPPAIFVILTANPSQILLCSDNFHSLSSKSYKKILFKEEENVCSRLMLVMCSE